MTKASKVYTSVYGTLASDFEVSDEIAKSHADDYEISKDKMYYCYEDDDCADYYNGDNYSESLCDYDE